MPEQVIAAEVPANYQTLVASNITEDGVLSAPVIVDGVELFRLRGVSAYPAQFRAKMVAKRIADAAADPEVTPDTITLEEGPDRIRILANKKLLLGVFDVDGELENINKRILAETFQASIVNAVDRWRHDRTPEVLRQNTFFAIGTTLFLIIVLSIGHWLSRRLRNMLENRLKRKVQDVKILRFKLFERKQLIGILSRALSLLWFGIVIFSIYLYLHGVLSLFPWTRGMATWLFTILIDPVHTLSAGIIHAIPDLVFLVVLFFIAKYILKLIRLFFVGIAEKKVVLAGFEADWAWPTYRLVRMMLIIFTLIVAYPYIPGSSTGAFKGISIFIGVLFSLGSSSLIGNFIAGYTMTYRRAFKIGDRVRIGEHIGDVTEIRLLVTHLRTMKNEEVVIPNSMILNGEVVNYSSLAPINGLILHTTVGIGYDTPWRQVEAMLLEAASRTNGLQSDPAPFVQQKSLGDFCILYEINAYCSDSKKMNQFYSALHRNILDVFNEYEVQIMSPAYERDPEQPKLVPKEKWFAEPAQSPAGSD